MKSVVVGKLLIAGFLLFYGNELRAQEKTFTEDAMSFEILKWHYHYYPNSSNNVWKQIGQGKNMLYRCDFQYKGDNISAYYKNGGTLVSEELDMKEKIPISLVHYLDDRYDKYKVVSFMKVSTFLSANQKEVVYEMDVRNKEHGTFTLNFDENLIPYPDNLLSEN